jgi:predicted amidohydrolase
MKTFIQTLRLSLLATVLFTTETSAGTVTDLFAEPNGWKSWAQREEVAPKFELRQPTGSSETAVLAIDSRGDRDVFGCWMRSLPPLRKDRRYRFEATFSADGIDMIGRRVWAIITHSGGQFQELNHDGASNGRHHMSLEYTPDKDYTDLALRLYLAWAPQGTVRWHGARVIDITDAPVAPRVAKLVAVSGRPNKDSTQAEALAFYLQRLDEAGAQGADLVCLPENINSDRVKVGADRTVLAEPIPGSKFVDGLAAKARQHKMYVAASVLERDGRRIYNTGVLLGRDGQVVGKYRKTHPTMAESLLKGTAPGDDYPVFDTDIGRIGYMICFDNHQPEVSRILGLKGADIIVFSNDSDGRERGTLYESYMRVRALDSQVHIVASVNKVGQSLIVNPRGEIVARAEPQAGALAVASCDLTLRVRDGSGRPIESRYWRVRRGDTFAPLLEDFADRERATVSPSAQ